jgi:hypothetical protein
MARCPPELLISTIKRLVLAHGVRELVVERNAFQGFLTNSADLREFCYTNGCLLNPHYTGSQKWDEDLGVASLAPLFLSCADHDVAADTWSPRPLEKRLITLPNPKFANFVDALTSQLCAWQPEANKRKQRGPTDLVMALWMASIGIQRVLDQAKNTPKHLANPFLTRADARSRGVVNLHEMREAQLRRETEVSFYA